MGLAMYVAGLCYCNRYLTDGFIPSEALAGLISQSKRQAKVCAERLSQANLFEPVEGGYAIHDYLRYQQSKYWVEKQREELEQEKERVRLAVQSTRARRNLSGNTPGNGNVTPDVTGDVTPPPSHTLPPREPNPTQPNPTDTQFAAEAAVGPTRRGDNSSNTDRQEKESNRKALERGEDLLAMFDEEEMADMGRRFPSLDLEWEAGKCVQWHMGRKGGSGNWKVSFKNWLDNAKENGKKNGDNSGNSQKNGGNSNGTIDAKEWIRRYGLPDPNWRPEKTGKGGEA